MAVVNVNSLVAGANLGCLKADTKPTANVPDGYVIIEFDSGNKFIFNKGAWYPYPSSTSITGSLANVKGAVVNVTTAGTRVQLPNVPCNVVTITAKRANTGYIYVGGSDVSSTIYGDDLATKESFTFQVANLNQLYIDSSVSGEGISYVAI